MAGEGAWQRERASSPAFWVGRARDASPSEGRRDAAGEDGRVLPVEPAGPGGEGGWEQPAPPGHQHLGVGRLGEGVGAKISRCLAARSLGGAGWLTPRRSSLGPPPPHTTRGRSNPLRNSTPSCPASPGALGHSGCRRASALETGPLGFARVSFPDTRGGRSGVGGEGGSGRLRGVPVRRLRLREPRTAKGTLNISV